MCLYSFPLAGLLEDVSPKRRRPPPDIGRDAEPYLYTIKRYPESTGVVSPA